MNVERFLSWFLQIGAIVSVAACAVGTGLMTLAPGGTPIDDPARLATLSCADFCAGNPGAQIALAGLIGLVGVSASRLIVCAILFFRPGDRKYSLFAIATLALIASAVAFRLW